MSPDLPDRVKRAYDRCKAFPEVGRNADGTFTVRGDAWLAMLELRHLMPDVMLALHELQTAEPREWAQRIVDNLNRQMPDESP